MNHLPNQINISSNDWYTLSGHFDEIVSGQVRAALQTAVAPEPEPTTLAHNDWRALSSHFDDETMGTPKPIAFTNYDVLFAPTSSSSPDDGDKVPKYTLINHVGNRRFLVLLNIYRQRYFEADEQGDEAECKRIALEIKTVRLQCVPQGRFLQQDAKNQWHEIRELASLVSIVEGEITKNVCSSKHGERPAKRARTASSIDFELPCQAATKKFPKALSLVHEPKPFDVICESDSITSKASAHHVGNSRFQVMLDMRIKDFEASCQEKRNMIAHDIVSTIIDDSSSQFLLLDGSSGLYVPLSRESAVVLTKNALNSKLVVAEKQKACNSEASQLVSRYYRNRVLDDAERQNNVIMQQLPMKVTRYPMAA
jgi:hypothetical protein